MPAEKHIVVVGAGIVGASMAWHLVRAGARVTVVASSGEGGVATPNSFAWLNASWGNPKPYFDLRSRSMAEWRRLASDLPALPLRWSGALCFDLPADDLEAVAREHASWGYGVRRVGRDEAARIEPSLRNPPDFAVHVAAEGAVEPVEATRILLADARRLGATLRTDTCVVGLLADQGRISGVRAGSGRLAADEVVLAAGAGCVELLTPLGIDLPVVTPPGLLVHSRPCARRLNGLVIGDVAHVRQTVDGRLVAGADFGGADPGVDAEETARALFARVKAMLADADGLALDFHTIGYRPTPADGFPIVGRPPGAEGLYVAVMHSGITLAPAVGLFAAEEILSGRRDALLSPYGPARLGNPAVPPT